jgi:hypothetical protein
MKSKSINPTPKKMSRAYADKAAVLSAGNFVRALLIDDVPEKGLDISIRANEAECAAMAKSSGLVAIANLEADFHVVKQSGAKLKVIGVLRARLQQTCVVSLDPFETEIQADIDVDFAVSAETAASHGRRGREIEPEEVLTASYVAQLDAPDPIVDGRIDLGAVAEEFLVLSLDPYPRKPGARFDEAGLGDNPVEKISPFAVLKKLKEEH